MPERMLSSMLSAIGEHGAEQDHDVGEPAEIVDARSRRRRAPRSNCAAHLSVTTIVTPASAMLAMPIVR